MKFGRNLPQWERALRVTFGLVLVIAALARFESPLLVGALIATGLTAIVTGLFAFCPVCAVAGRRPQP
ncbi:DUF2892 domain-containing protein [Novosphingobium sp.]|uniref:YgaP family membrane protein n=1 Tax=Novosphingobium sp. TaxID=1874826 RepID=UPI001DAA62CE|nr:DUF2892 domain-containing protein [Novosphingobium sp.]MBX9663677.1 DUF2892 domain-containing protein [Novosphingobium sp.]